MSDEERERFIQAYMTVTRQPREAAEAIVEILLDPDPSTFLRGLSEWAEDWRS